MIGQVAALGVLLGGCKTRSPLEKLPPGLVAIGNAPALAPLLDALTSWSDTRIANATAAARPQIDACPGPISLSWPEQGPPTITCGEDAALAPLREIWPEQPAQALLFALPDHGNGRATGSLIPGKNGDFGVELRVPAPRPGSAWDLLIPAVEGPGPWRLSSAGALVHARVRQDRAVDIPALIGAQNQGETLFHLKSDLFSSAVLDRTWELAIYPPAEGMAMPRMALAVGVRSAALAQQAADQYLATLSKQWTFQAEPWAEGDHHGACLRHLNLLPELEPCYAITADSLAITWNQASLSHAFQPSAGVTAAPDRSRAILDFARFPEVDRALTKGFSEADGPLSEQHYPWKTVEISASLAEGEVVVHLEAVAP